MHAPSEDWALADAIALEGMGSGTIEHMAACWNGKSQGQ